MIIGTGTDDETGTENRTCDIIEIVTISNWQTLLLYFKRKNYYASLILRLPSVLIG